jgi:hypothetical protein
MPELCSKTHINKDKTVMKDHNVATVLTRKFSIGKTTAVIGPAPKSKGKSKPAPVRGANIIDCDAISRILTAFARRCAANPDHALTVPLEVGGVAIKYSVRSKSPAPIDDDDIRPESEEGAEVAIERTRWHLVAQHPNGARVPLIVVVKRDRQSANSLEVTTDVQNLLAGATPCAIALGDQNPGPERRKLCRAPFEMLRAILQALEPGFLWKPETQARIEKLDIAVRSMEIRTRLALPTGTDAKEFLALICALYSITGTNGAIIGGPLSDWLRVKFTRIGEHALTVKKMTGYSNQNKHRFKATFTFTCLSPAAKHFATKMTDDDTMTATLQFSAVLGSAALNDLLQEAKLIDKPATFATVCTAIGQLNNKEGKTQQRFMHWIMAQIFDEVLALRQLISFDPKRFDRMIEEAKKEVPGAAQALTAWVEHGCEYGNLGPGTRPVSFQTFATTVIKTPCSEKDAREIRKLLLAKGINLDIPRRLYEDFYKQTFIWGMTKAQQQEYTAALSTNNKSKIAELQQASRLKVNTKLNKLRKWIEALGDAVKIPALQLSALAAQKPPIRPAPLQHKAAPTLPKPIPKVPKPSKPRVRAI